MPVLENAWIGYHDQSDEDYYTQAGDLFRLMTDDQKQQLVGNIAGGLSQANRSIQERFIALLEKCDPAYASGVKNAMEVIAKQA